MAIAVDVAGTVGSNTGTASTTVTYTGLTPSASPLNGAAIFVFSVNDISITPSAVTWNGSSTGVTIISTDGGATLSNQILIGVVGLGAVGTHTLQFTTNTAVTWVGCGISFTGVNQTGSTTTWASHTTSNVTTNTTLTGTQVTANGDATFCGFGYGNVFSSINNTALYHMEDPTGGEGGAAAYHLSTTTSDSYTFTQGSGDYILRSSVHIVAAATAAANPVQNRDWPNPRSLPYWEYSSAWLDPGNNFPPLPGGPMPHNQYDWPNPYPVTWYRDWSRNLLQTTLAPAFVFPFNQYYWPLPVGNPRPDEFYSFSNLEVIANQPASYFHIYDFPNPQPVYWYRDWYQALALQLPVTMPFNQYDWPNPRTYAPIDQFWFNNLVEFLSQTNPLPFNQYDWPLPKTPQPIDQFWFQSLVLNLPEPIPPPPTISAGRQITEEEVRADLATWWKKIIAHADGTISDSLSQYGRRGGIARANSLSANQRTAIATLGANSRWKR